MHQLLPSAGDADLEAAYAVGQDLPWHVRASFICSADGAVVADGSSRPLAGAGDRAVFGLLRDLSDLVLVGAGTVRAEGYRVPHPRGDRLERRRRHGMPDAPRLAVVSARLDLDPDDDLFTAATTRPTVITHEGAPADRREALAQVADVVVAGHESVDLGVAADQLRARGFRRVHCEGGPMLFGAALTAGIVDELCLTIAPLLAGSGAGRIVAGTALEAPDRMRILHVLEDDDGYLYLRYALPRAPQAHASP